MQCSPPPPTMLPPLVPPLPDELLEEVFLHLPPDEPECLVRASLASKLWLRTLSGPRFRGLYHQFHGAPPMLGFVYVPALCTPDAYSLQVRDGEVKIPYFQPTTKFHARIPDDDWGDRDYEALDCRHGRVLFADMEGFTAKLLVWNPMTGCRRELDGPEPPDNAGYLSLGPAVLCAVTGCDHRACHEGPFRVVLVSMDKTDVGCVAYAHTSLPQMGEGSKPSAGLSLEDEWTKLCPELYLDGVHALIGSKPALFIEDALYFVIENHGDDEDHGGDVVAILKCDLAANCLSLIDAPPLEADTVDASETILVVMEGGSLGCAQLDGLTLYLWSMQTGIDRVMSWNQHRVINLKEILPIQNCKKRITLSGSVDGTDTIFVTTDLGVYGISLKSLSVKKLWKGGSFLYMLPYMSFYNPREKVKNCNAMD